MEWWRVLFRVGVDKCNKKGSHEEPFLLHLLLKLIFLGLLLDLNQYNHFVFQNFYQSTFDFKSLGFVFVFDLDTA